jgi:predicted PurR-regulated permease PerM
MAPTDRQNGIRLGPQLWFGLFSLIIAVWATITHIGLVGEVIAVLFGSFLISLAMRPAADFLSRWKVPRGVTVILIYVLVLAVLALIGGFAGTAIGGQVVQLIENGPALIQRAADSLQSIPIISQTFPSLDSVAQDISRGVQALASALLGAATGAGRIVIELLMVLFIAFFFTTDVSIGERLIDTWSPERYKHRIRAVALYATERLKRWVGAQIMLIAYFAVVYGAGLLIIGVPFAVTIALIGGLLELVPFVGGATALILSVIAALTVRPALVIWVLVLYIVVAQIESNIVLPHLYGQAVDVHPVIILVALFIGGRIGGVFGALFTVPAVVVVAAIIKEFRQTGDLPDAEDDG